MLGPLFGCVIKRMGTCVCAVEIGVQLGNLVLPFMALDDFFTVKLKICFTVAYSESSRASLCILDTPRNMTKSLACIPLKPLTIIMTTAPFFPPISVMKLDNHIRVPNRFQKW